MATPIPQNRARFTLAEVAQACADQLRHLLADCGSAFGISGRSLFYDALDHRAGKGDATGLHGL